MGFSQNGTKRNEMRFFDTMLYGLIRNSKKFINSIDIFQNEKKIFLINLGLQNTKRVILLFIPSTVSRVLWVS